MIDTARLQARGGTEQSVETPVDAHAPATSSTPRASVLVAAYQRAEGLRRLLRLLETQTVPPDDFEVVVVDDGSTVPIALDDLRLPYRLTLLRQENAGPATARHRAALAARGDVLIVVDDDMQIEPGFVAGHLAMHPVGSRRAALGPVEPDPDVHTLPLFEQWNADRLHRVTLAAAAGTARLRGNNLWSGNVSFRRDDYLAVGGFDPTLRVSEDLELGLRLEESGVEITFATDAPAVHRSDHVNATWLRRASVCGQADKRVVRKHPAAVHADPWRYYFVLPGYVRPMLDFVIGFPAAGRRLATALTAFGQLLLSLGMRGVALRIAAVVYATEYFRGIRLDEGSRQACRRALGDYLARAAALPELPPEVPRRRAHWARLRADLAADHATRAAQEAKYGYVGTPGMRPRTAFVHKIGVQMMTMIRLMSYYRDAGRPTLARITSRVIRHLYGSDVHWDATWAPGTTIVHGFGLAISHAARIGPECIVFQNVCLGMGIDAETRQTGAPTLGRGVHVGPGATLLGPIVVGEGSKVMAGAVLTTSVPAWSLVETPAPSVRSRRPVGGTPESAGEP
jgi:serine acetyltransferase/GT2 family glycosyltransferase